MRIQGNLSSVSPCSTATTYVPISMHMSTAVWKDCCPHCISLLKRRKRASYLQTSLSKPLGLQPSLELRKLCSWPKGLVSHIPDSLSHFCICSLSLKAQKWGVLGTLVRKPFVQDSPQNCSQVVVSSRLSTSRVSLIWISGWEAKALWIEE